VAIQAGLRPTNLPSRPLTEVARWAGTDLLQVTDGARGLAPADPAHAADVRVSGVVLDSRSARPGDLYAGLPGARTHGARHAIQAVDGGAVAVLTDPAGAELAAQEGTVPPGIPLLVVPGPREVLGSLAGRVYGEPSAHLGMVGVTGTNGKTTTTFLVDDALRALGRSSGLVGTVEVRVGDERIASARTTPEAPDLHALLAVMCERGAATCSVEVSSHALRLHRVDGVVFDIAVFTNLSQDHLDFHDGMEDYFAAKSELFTPVRARRGVVCVDDPWGARLAAATPLPVVTLATTDPTADADWVVHERIVGAGGTDFTLVHRSGRRVAAASPIPGAFNVANSALAVLVLAELGVEVDQAAAAVRVAGPVPGRMERVLGAGTAGEPFAVVDYAHTPDAVRAALEALGPGAGRPLVVVLGAGGDRDRDKRPAMGEAAARRADVVLVTDDNPRSEDPAAIRAAVAEGARRGAAASGALVLEVPGRRAAIAQAVVRAWGAGTVLVAGKGHEQGQDVAGTVHPFDDRRVLREELLAAGPEQNQSERRPEEHIR